MPRSDWILGFKPPNLALQSRALSGMGFFRDMERSLSRQTRALSGMGTILDMERLARHSSGLTGSAITGGNPALSQTLKGITGSAIMGGNPALSQTLKGITGSVIMGGTNSTLAQVAKSLTGSVTTGGMNSTLLSQAVKGFPASTSMGGMNPALAQVMNGLTGASAPRGMRSMEAVLQATRGMNMAEAAMRASRGTESFEAVLKATRGMSVAEAAMRASRDMGPLEAVLKATRGMNMAEAAMRASRGIGSFEAVLGINQVMDSNRALSNALKLGRVSMPPAPKPTAVRLVRDLAVTLRRLEDELEKRDRKTEEQDFRILALEEERDEQRILLADQHQVLCHLVYSRISDLVDWTGRSVEQIVDLVLAAIPDGVVRQDLLELRDDLIQLVDGPSEPTPVTRHLKLEHSVVAPEKPAPDVQPPKLHDVNIPVEDKDTPNPED